MDLVKKLILILTLLLQRNISFLRNIFDRESIMSLEKYHELFKKFLQTVILLNTSYSRDSDVEHISDDWIVQFMDENNFENVEELSEEISKTKIKSFGWQKSTTYELYHLITFVYSTIMNFPDKQLEIKTVITKNFLNDVSNLMFGEVVIHYLHITGKIVGYAYNCCNKKLRETQKVIPVFAHNLFSFDFFVVVKGIRLSVWRTEQLNIGDSNLTNVQ